MSKAERPYEGILICADFDGTLSTHNQIPEANINAIQDFCQKGGFFTISSGRDAPYLVEKAGGLFNAPLICVNGTKIVDAETGETVYAKPMDKTALAPLTMQDVMQPVFVEIILDDGFSEGFVLREDIDLTRYESTPILKIVTLYKTEEDCILAKEQLSHRFPQYQYARSFPTGLEQISASAGKGSCVNFLKARLGVKKALCIGDFENDISMLRVADIAFAPQNALPEVKAYAQHIVAHADEGTLADMIRMLPDIL